MVCFLWQRCYFSSERDRESYSHIPRYTARAIWSCIMRLERRAYSNKHRFMLAAPNKHRFMRHHNMYLKLHNYCDPWLDGPFGELLLSVAQRSIVPFSKTHNLKTYMKTPRSRAFATRLRAAGLMLPGCGAPLRPKQLELVHPRQRPKQTRISPVANILKSKVRTRYMYSLFLDFLTWKYIFVTSRRSSYDESRKASLTPILRSVTWRPIGELLLSVAQRSIWKPTWKHLEAEPSQRVCAPQDWCCPAVALPSPQTAWAGAPPSTPQTNPDKSVANISKSKVRTRYMYSFFLIF